MLSRERDRETVESVVKICEEGDMPEIESLRDAFDRLIVDVETLEMLEASPVCRRCPITALVANQTGPKQ